MQIYSGSRKKVKKPGNIGSKEKDMRAYCLRCREKNRLYRFKESKSDK